MPDLHMRMDHVRRSSLVAAILALAGVAGLLLTAGLVVFTAGQSRTPPTAVAAIGAISGALFLGAIYLFLRGLLEVILKVEATAFRTYDVLRELKDAARQSQKQLEVISENVQLSDAVRALMHRDRERTALRLAINEEIIRGDIEAAYALVEQLEDRHGYKNEAARLRSEVDASFERLNHQKVHEAVEHVRSLLGMQQWDSARRAMDRLLPKYPEHAEVQELPRLFTIHRGEHKRRLLKDWDDAVRRNEVDRGIAILKELDQYLTRNEAAALEESARGVFRTKLHNLGLQFSLAVSDHNWKEALEVGRQIVDEFPNSRMAQEVRDRIEVLEKRADEGGASLTTHEESRSVAATKS